MCWPCSSSPSLWVPLQVRGWRLLRTPPLSGDAGGPAGIPQVGRAAQRTPNLSLWMLPKRVWLAVALECHPSGGWHYTPHTLDRHTEPPRPYTRGAVCPPADAVAARKCLHGDGRSRVRAWRNTSGSVWWGEGPSGEKAPGLGGGEVSSVSASGREAFKPRPRGSEALVATAVRGRAGCGTRGDTAQSAGHPGAQGLQATCVTRE